MHELKGSTITEFMTAIARREIATAKAGLRYPLMLEGLFYGPRQYQPSLRKKLSALENYLKVAAHVLPENKATHASVLWHGDLHSQNIFVDAKDPGRIVGIIDWQSVSACPLFMQVGAQRFLITTGLSLEICARAQTLHNFYLVRCHQTDETIFHAIQGQNTLRHQVSVVPGLVLMDYEPLLNSLPRDVEKEWARVVVGGCNAPPGTTPFPLQFSDEEIH
ncbi:hypothetical protein PISL3812_04147 [Talaromyces islandicus]|uniref:Altered inheritance of mitochondria protein 9, mitochondrial n=1 Tax=Talaromyces islandicus TaxID=28573 RepID=A0A0U1LVK6_TALIS|nr:hypothetical protein PISL3812_04147 [Talaromyces islandicus]